MAGDASSVRHAEILRAIGEALELQRIGRPATVACPVCGHALKIDLIEELAITYVSCGTGCASFRLSLRSRCSTES